MRVLLLSSLVAAATAFSCPAYYSRQLITRTAGHPIAQLVRVEKSDDDEGDDSDDTILQVSQVVDENGTAQPATGRSVASLQFMITNAMRAQLFELGYSAEEIDAMAPPRAAEIIATATPSSKLQQSKPKQKKDRFELQFTCNVCGGPNSHSISKHAYTKGTVVVTCPKCQSMHLVADHLNWIEDDFSNLEEFMAKRGTPVTKIADGDVAATAAAEVWEAEPEAEVEAKESPPIKPLDGITDEQALRIREAVRKNKQRRRIEKQAERASEDE